MVTAPWWQTNYNRCVVQQVRNFQNILVTLKEITEKDEDVFTFVQRLTNISEHVPFFRNIPSIVDIGQKSQYHTCRNKIQVSTCEKGVT